ncbi:hypothetical protein FQN54_004088 [Arachnomyces sp. PD_36]|nr:hypothetical protein FQN54_004088 [Arachnomyces sp. PD_36]
MSSNEQTPFGHPMLKHFCFKPGYTPLNNGAYGGLPAPVLSKFHSLHADFESSPDQFLRFKKHALLTQARREIAALLNAPLNETVFIQNVTGAVGTVLRNLKWESGDTIVFFETSFPACVKGVASVVEMMGDVGVEIEARKVQYTMPITHDEVVRRFREVVGSVNAEGTGKRVKIAIFDTVVSVPGVRFPFERLVEVCREEGVMSFVDGAHGLGLMKLDLGMLDADFFVSCAHKWFHSPRGTCIFHVPLRNQHLFRTTFPTSHGFAPNPPPHLAPTFSSILGKPPAPRTATTTPPTPFETLFESVATMDMAQYFSVPEAIRFRREVCGGEEAVMRYCVDVVREGGDRGAEILGTEVMQEEGGLGGEGGRGKLRDCPFANLRLPVAVGGTYRGEGDEGKFRMVTIEASEAGKVLKWMEEKMMFEMKTFVTTFVHGGWVWSRVSGQVYVEVGDIEWLARGLKGLCERVAKGEWREEK